MGSRVASANRKKDDKSRGQQAMGLQPSTIALCVEYTQTPRRNWGEGTRPRGNITGLFANQRGVILSSWILADQLQIWHIYDDQQVRYEYTQFTLVYFCHLFYFKSVSQAT